ncbi:MAG TPA: energy transducer TonB, partial [Bacteroidales bacterium]
LFIFTGSLSHSQSSAPQPLMTKLILKDFLNIQFDYPQQSIDKNEEGTVKIHFKTDKNGAVTFSEITNSVSKEIDSTALFLFKLIVWQPATDYGLAVDGESDFELDFKIKKFEKLAKSRGYRHITYPFKPVDNSFNVYNLKQLTLPPEAILDSNYTSLSDFVYHQLMFPEAAIKLHISGNVTVQLVIETNGLPSNINVTQSVGGGCTEEAIRIIQMIKWMPGIKDGMAVRTNYEMFIKFVPPKEGMPGYIPSQSGSGL